jgi:hypothetical protein
VQFQVLQSKHHVIVVYSVFSTFSIDFAMIAGFIFQLFFTLAGKGYLTMDCTNWQWGKSDINILTLAIVFKGIAIPIYWELLDKRCNKKIFL